MKKNENIYIYEVPYWKKKNEYVDDNMDIVYNMRVGHIDKHNRWLPIALDIAKNNYEKLLHEEYFLGVSDEDAFFTIFDMDYNRIPLVGVKQQPKQRLLKRNTK